MTGQIIQMPSDDHRDIQALLPWFVTGELEALERDRVQTHVEHCAECRAELASESLLAREMAQLPAAFAAAEVEHGWKVLSRSLEGERPAPAHTSGWFSWLKSGPWLPWAVAAQFCLLMLMGAVLWWDGSPRIYHALGSAAPAADANVVVIFRPETPEHELRNLLKSSGARLVGGPTASDAYLLHVTPAARAAVVARLRQEREIVLVEPIDGG
jgi:anti-sigma factor RsiW